MKAQLITMAGAVAVLAGMTTAVEAIPINGRIAFTGEFTQHGGTAISGTIHGMGIGNTTGGFAVAATHSFTINSESQRPTRPAGPHLFGTGTITDGTAADAVAGTWRWGFGGPGNSSERQHTGAANAVNSAVPDGGSTVALLGASVFGLCFFRKKVIA